MTGGQTILLAKPRADAARRRLLGAGLAGVFVVTAAGIALVRFRCSPWYPPLNDINSDVYVYQAVGNAWAHGLLPYRDVYDVKGPFLYLLFGLFARLRPWSMGPPLVTLAVLALASLCLAYALARRQLRHRSLAAVAAVLACLVIYLSPAEVPTSFTCEELAVPGVLLLLWLTSRWLGHGEHVRDAWWVLDGIVLGALSWTKYQVSAPWVAMLVALLVLRIRGDLSARRLGRVVLLHLVGLVVATAGILACYVPVLPDLLRAYFLAKVGGLRLDHELGAQAAFAVSTLTHDPVVGVALLGSLGLLAIRTIRGGGREALALTISCALSLWAATAFVRHSNNVFVPLSFVAVTVPYALAVGHKALTALGAGSRTGIWVTAVGSTAVAALACVGPLIQGMQAYGLLQRHQSTTCYELPSTARTRYPSNVSVVFARAAGDQPILSLGTLYAARSSYVSRLTQQHPFEFVDSSWSAAIGADAVQARYLQERTLPYAWIHISEVDRFHDLEGQIASATYTDGPSQPAQAAALVRHYVPVLACNNEILLRAR